MTRTGDILRHIGTILSDPTFPIPGQFAALGVILLIVQSRCDRI